MTLDTPAAAQGSRAQPISPNLAPTRSASPPSLSTRTRSLSAIGPEQIEMGSTKNYMQTSTTNNEHLQPARSQHVVRFFFSFFPLVKRPSTVPLAPSRPAWAVLLVIILLSTPPSRPTKKEGYQLAYSGVWLVHSSLSEGFPLGHLTSASFPPPPSSTTSPVHFHR